MSVKVIVFDVGETLVDETRAWTEAAREAAIPAFTLFTALGVLIERGQHHREVWPMLGATPPVQPATIAAEDFYPDAQPALQALRQLGYRLGLAGNQPERAQEQLGPLGLPVDFIASSAAWGVEKPADEFFQRVTAAAGVEPAEIAYVGDRVDNDVGPAARHGMRAVFLLRGPWALAQAAHPDADLAALRIRSLLELPAAVFSL